MRKKLLCLAALSCALRAATPAIDTNALLGEAFPSSPAEASALSAAPAELGLGAVSFERGRGDGSAAAPEPATLEILALGSALLVISQALRATRKPE